MAGKHVGAWRNSDDPLPGFEWNERTTKAYAEGRYNIAPNGHVAGSDAYRAYVAGAANAGDLDQAFESGGGAGGGPPGPVFDTGYLFNAVSTAESSSNRTWALPASFSVEFRIDDALGGTRYLLCSQSQGFNVRKDASAQMVIQWGGTTATFTTFIVELGKLYRFSATMNADLSVDATFDRITDGDSLTDNAQVIGSSDMGDSILWVGGADSGAGVVEGIIGEVTYSEPGESDSWPMAGTGADTTAPNTATPANPLINFAPGTNGVWWP